MPHSVPDTDPVADQDDETIQMLLNNGPTEDILGGDITSRPLEIGEKADDALDYADISDDDLADEEDDVVMGEGEGKEGADELDNLFGGDDQANGIYDTTQEGDNIFGDPTGDAEELDDLFGGDFPSSPKEAPTAQDNYINGTRLPGSVADDAAREAPRLSLPGLVVPKREPTQTPPTSAQPLSSSPPADGFPDALDVEDDDDPAVREQMALFASARRKQQGLDSDMLPPETDKELFRILFPEFEEHEPPRWMRLIPQKRAFFVGKQPLKTPKTLQLTKVSLELGQDQEKAFKLNASGPKLSREADAELKGLILVEHDDGKDAASEESEMELDQLEDEEEIGGLTWQDLSIACADWSIPSPPSTVADMDVDLSDAPGSDADADEWGLELSPRPVKKVKTAPPSVKDLPTFYDQFPSLDDPERATAKLGQRVTLDMNDPRLLLEELDPEMAQLPSRKVGVDIKRAVGGNIKKALAKRFNISNDEAYDQLKENHQQHKVRNLIGNESLEHSLPALKLQYPFYKVKLTPREARSFHRPTLHFKVAETAKISKIKKGRKRKQLKGLSAIQVYSNAQELSLNESNSDMLLLEYSEEQPIILSNFGMQSRLINYYRRKDDNDTTRPKLDLGETSVLLPKDQGPFSSFGSVDPGETVPTVTNQLYRAPVFKHDPKYTDFLVVRSSTGQDGHNWFIRNIANIMVVGQQFPSMEVPGTHSRKVTEASKNRLKMLSYRIWRKNERAGLKSSWLSNEEIRDHLPGTDIAQNRSKLREFMKYDKVQGCWIPSAEDYDANGGPETLRRIAPETICLLDSMQVGNQHLHDAGYNKDENGIAAGDEEKDGESMEEQMAPWNTTKNFLNACQGKAMLQLHGEGDPSGRGEAFSFVKISMKGGFRAVGESIEDRLSAEKLKENGGHRYNVKKQEEAYNDAIKRIWAVQRQSLSSAIEHSDVEVDVENTDNDPSGFGLGRTPRSEFGTPAAFPRHDDETTSQFSRFSNASQRGKVLRIVRKVKNRETGKMETKEEVIRDAKVMREYLRRRKEKEVAALRQKIGDLKPTGDAEIDAQQQRMYVYGLASCL